jgi:hypothetical protein
MWKLRTITIRKPKIVPWSWIRVEDKRIRSKDKRKASAKDENSMRQIPVNTLYVSILESAGNGPKWRFRARQDD